MKWHTRNAVKHLIEACEEACQRNDAGKKIHTDKIRFALRLAYNMGLGGEYMKPETLKDAEAKMAAAQEWYANSRLSVTPTPADGA